MLPDNYFDLVFVDASHAYSKAKEDIEHWLPKVKRGGILAGHDYYMRWPGVVKAVNELFPEELYTVAFLPDTVWYTVKA